MRIALILTVAILLGACSDGSGPPTTTAAPTTESSLAEPDSNLTEGEADLTEGEADLTEGEATTASVPVDFDTLPGTPPNAFDSFAATMTMAMTLGDIALDITGEGTWTDDAFSCTVSSGLGGITFGESMIATTETLWIDTGNGFEESGMFSPTAQQIMGSCPTSPLFWANFQGEDFGGVTGPEELIDGRPAYKADLSELLQALDDVGGLAGYEGATVNEMTIWVDVETGSILAMTADMEISEDMMGDFGAEGTGAVAIVMDFTITNVNDPSLVVEAP